MAAAAVVVEGVGVVDEVEDDGDFVVAAAEIEDEDNVAVAAAAVDGEGAPPTLSALNVAPNVPVVAAPVGSNWKDAADTPSALPVSPSSSPSPSRTDESPSPYRYPCP